MTTVRNQTTNEILTSMENHEKYAESKCSIYKRIIEVIKKSTLRDIETSDAVEKIFDVVEKMEIFSDNLSLEDIYTIQDDMESRDKFERVKKDIADDTSTLKRNTIDFTDVRIPTVSKSLHEDPHCVDTLRYFLGMGKITFELIASVWLYNEGMLESPLRKMPLRMIKGKLRQDTTFCDILSRNLITSGLRQKISPISKMQRQERHSFVELLSIYQTRGRLAKLRGHMAEKIVAQILRDNKIPFEPSDKLNILGSPDIKISFLNDRQVDFAIPNKEKPKILIQAAYYTSNTGSVASKTVKESVLTKQQIERYNRENGTDIKFIGLIDGFGWIDMSGFLIKMLLYLDDFFQLNTKDRLLKAIKESM